MANSNRGCLFLSRSLLAMISSMINSTSRNCNNSDNFWIQKLSLSLGSARQILSSFLIYSLAYIAVWGFCIYSVILFYLTLVLPIDSPYLNLGNTKCSCLQPQKWVNLYDISFSLWTHKISCFNRSETDVYRWFLPRPRHRYQDLRFVGRPLSY